MQEGRRGMWVERLTTEYYAYYLDAVHPGNKPV